MNLINFWEKWTFKFQTKAEKSPKANLSRRFGDLAQVVQTLDSAIQRINHYPADSVIDLCNTYPLDCDLSGG